MDKGPLLVGNISPKIFTADDKPAVAHLVLDLFFDDACHFTVLLCLEDALDICNFFDG